MLLLSMGFRKLLLIVVSEASPYYALGKGVYALCICLKYEIKLVENFFVLVFNIMSISVGNFHLMPSLKG